MNLLHQVLPKGVCKGLLWLSMTYICVAFLNHAIEVGSCKSQPKRTTNAFCHFKGLWRVSLIAKDGWSLALLYAPNFLPFSLVPALPAIPLSQAWHFCVRLRARSVFYRVHILRCLGPAQAQPVYKSGRWSHDVVWVGSVWSALLPAPEGTGSVFPHYQHRAAFEIGLLWRWRFSKLLCTGEASETHRERGISALGAGSTERESSLQHGNRFAVWTTMLKGQLSQFLYW